MRKSPAQRKRVPFIKVKRSYASCTATRQSAFSGQGNSSLSFLVSREPRIVISCSLTTRDKIYRRTRSAWKLSSHNDSHVLTLWTMQRVCRVQTTRILSPAKSKSYPSECVYPPISILCNVVSLLSLTSHVCTSYITTVNAVASVTLFIVY